MIWDLRYVRLLAIGLISSNYALSQARQEHTSETHTRKEHGIYEVITSAICVLPLDGHERWGGTEVHLTYWFDHIYGSGFSYTAKFEEKEVAHEIALLFSWNAKKWITFNLGPNFAVPNSHRDFALSAYAETEINVRPREWFHYGPILGTILGEKSELTAGFHLGFEF